jgi:hypothetical protein
MELGKLKDWIGRRETDLDYVTIPAVNRPFQVCGEPYPDNKTAKLWVVDQDGAPTLIAEAEFK